MRIFNMFIAPNSLVVGTFFDAKDSLIANAIAKNKLATGSKIWWHHRTIINAYVLWIIWKE